MNEGETYLFFFWVKIYFVCVYKFSIKMNKKNHIQKVFNNTTYFCKSNYYDWSHLCHFAHKKPHFYRINAYINNRLQSKTAIDAGYEKCKFHIFLGFSKSSDINHIGEIEINMRSEEEINQIKLKKEI